jgi:hypothetical protein
MRPYVICSLVCLAVVGTEFSQPSAHARIFRFRRCRAVEATCPPVKEKIRVEPGSGGRFEMPDDVAIWFRATLKNSKVRDVRDSDGPLWDITPSLPAIVFREGDHTYELHFHLESMIEKHRGKTVRFHEHDAWVRLESFAYGVTRKRGTTLLQYLQEEAKAGQERPIRVEIVGLAEEIELPKDVGDWFRATLKQSKTNNFARNIPTPDSLPVLIFKDGQRTLELHGQGTLVGVTTSGRWGRLYSHGAFEKMYERSNEIRSSGKWDHDDRKTIVKTLWLEYFQNEAKSPPLEPQKRNR